VLTPSTWQTTHGLAGTLRATLQYAAWRLFRLEERSAEAYHLGLPVKHELRLGDSRLLVRQASDKQLAVHNPFADHCLNRHFEAELLAAGRQDGSAHHQVGI